MDAADFGVGEAKTKLGSTPGHRKPGGPSAHGRCPAGTLAALIGYVDVSYLLMT